ncbi:hypothetical protein EI546_05155 [Aequorivita sp. H23M31]|uniref:Bacterial Pleckstrin homology domain-containing protein n=1 Tax=Aequorivita ciconiae TaxID=2494375 RepID=A0A410G7B1_9FLAO|nr:hypothetical protein EI546_05155 [Aequorivita sp. H23M31]
MYFIEKQKFTQWWMWVILIGLAIMPIYGIYEQLIMGNPVGNHPVSNLVMVITTLFIFGLIYFNWYITLITEINSDGIKMRFIPFLKKDISWSEVESAQIVDYGFVGYGIRLGSKYGTIYNIKGGKGLALKLRNGKRFVIGTQKETELITELKKINIPTTSYN